MAISRRRIAFIISSAVTVLLMVTIASVVHARHKHQKANTLLLAQANTPIAVSVLPVKMIHVADHVQATGTLLPIQTTTITPKTDGYIKAIKFHEGETVKAGQLLIQLDNSQERGNLAQAKATLKIEHDTYQRNLKASKQHLVATQDLSNAQDSYENAKADLIMKQSAFDDKALHAPFAGRMGRFLLSVGDYVKAGNPLVKLTNDTQLIVQYSLPQRFINELKVGQPVNVKLTNNNKATAHGKISFIATNIDATTQTFVVHAIIDNQKHLLHPGNFVSVKQTIGIARPQVVVPLRSVIRSISGSSVFIVKDGISKQVNVTLGGIVGHDVIIRSGLNANDKVITAGQSQVKPGSHVKVVTP